MSFFLDVKLVLRYVRTALLFTFYAAPVIRVLSISISLYKNTTVIRAVFVYFIISIVVVSVSPHTAVFVDDL